MSCEQAWAERACWSKRAPSQCANSMSAAKRLRAATHGRSMPMWVLGCEQAWAEQAWAASRRGLSERGARASERPICRHLLFERNV